MITIAGYDITLLIFLLLGIIVATQRYHIQQLQSSNRRMENTLMYEFERNHSDGLS